MSLVPADSSEVPIGLEDFGMTDMVMPTVSIDHETNTLVDNLSNEHFETITVVLLGLVKQRTLWTPDPTDDPPLCRSYDFATGIPNPENPLTFPWKASGFSFSDFEKSDGTLACENCALKNWGSHPKTGAPWCSEQWVIPLVLEAGEGGPAVITFQRTSLKPVRAYSTNFQRTRSPLFTAITRISLNAQRKGSVNYSVPSFAKVGETPAEWHPEFIAQYLRIRQYLTTPRMPAADKTAEAPAPAPASKAHNARAVSDEDF